MLSCLEKISFCSVLLCIYSVAYPSAGPDTNPIRSSAIQVAQFEKQLKHGDIKVNELNPAGLTPLQEAICESNVDIVSLLCDYEKTDINAYSSKGFTALHYAIEKSDCKCTGCHTCDSCKIINSLFRRKSLTVDQPKRYCYRISTYLPFHTTPYDEGMTALHIAASKGDLKNAKLLIEHNANVNALTCWGRSPLHYAAYRSDKQGKYAETIELLYTSHALIDQEDHFKETPLIAAIKSPAIRKDDNSLDNNITSIEKLLERGANINHISGRKTNKTPLIAAVQKNDLTLVEWLVNRGAQVNVKNIYGCTALDIAIAENYEEIQRFLIAKGAHYTFGKRYLASLEPKPACILYPLHEAADAGNLDRLQAILSQTAGSCVAVNGVDDYMRTPLHYAACADRNEIIVYLLAQSGRMYSCDIEGKTPLELAIENGKIKSVKCFLDQPGIEEYLKSEHTEAITIGTHLLTIAASKKREDIVLELYNHKAILPDKPLSWAVQNNLENLTQKILATPEMQVNSEQTKTAKIEALKIAVEQLNTKMIKILIEAGTSIEETQQYLALLKNSASDPKKKILLEIIENIFVNLTDIETIVTQHQDFNEYDEKEGLICLQDSELKELGIHGTIRASLQQTRSDADYHRNYSGYYAIFNALNPLEIHNADKRRHFTSFFRASLTYLKQIGINPPYDNLTAQQLDLLLTEIKKNPGGFGIKDTNVLDKVIILPTEQLYSFLNAEVKLEKPYAAKVLNVFNTFAITQVDLLSIIISNNSSPKNWYSITAYKEGSDTSINIYHPALRLQKWQQRLLYNICATDLIYYFVMLTQPIQKWKNLLNQAFKTEIDRVCFSCKELPNFKAKPVIDILNNFTECLLRINNSIGLIRSEFAEVDSTSTQCIVHALRLGLFAQEYDLLFKKLFHYFCETKQKGSTDTKIITFIRNHALCVEQLKENFNLIAFDKTMSCGKKNQLGAEMLETIDKIIVDINTLKNEISTNPHSLTSGKFYDAAPGEIPAEKFKLIEKFIPIQLKEIVQSQASAVTGKRLIFYGEPGNGKTTIAQAFAQLCLFVDTDGTRKPRPFHMVRVPALGTKYRFSKQNQLSELYTYIKQNPYAVILLDEIDALADSEYMQDQSVQDLQQLIDLADSAKIIFIGTTNSDISKLSHQDSFDRTNKPLAEPFLTRFEAIKIDNPSLDHRRAIIKNCRATVSHNNPYMSVVLNKGEEEAIAQHTNGFSIRDIEAVFTIAVQHAFRIDPINGETSTLAKFKQVTYNHFNEAIQAITKGKRINYIHLAMLGLKAFVAHGPNWLGLANSLYSTYRHGLERNEDRLERYQERLDTIIREKAHYDAIQAAHKAEMASALYRQEVLHDESRRDFIVHTGIAAAGLVLAFFK